MDILPEEIQTHIVSFLPVKEAIRTSTLSKKWKKICSSLSNLRFGEYYTKENVPLSLEQFIDIVYQTLGQHDESDINIFQLNLNPFLQNPYEFDFHINEWIDFAVSHNVQQLELFGPELKKLPFFLVSCNSLKVLSLSYINLIMLPNIRLPNLKTLDLICVTFSDVGVTNQLFSSCPALEGLTISYCFWSNSFRVLTVSSPNLTVFTLRYNECFQEIALSTKNLRKLCCEGSSPNFKTDMISSLEEADLNFSNMQIRDLFGRDKHWASEFLMGLRNVVKLSLRSFYLEVLTREQDLLVRLPSDCCTLKHLHLDLYPTKIQVQVLMFLLRSYPNLQTLTVFVKTREENPILWSVFNVEANWKTQELNTDGMLKQLRRAECKSFGGSEFELDLVKFLLENADVMEEMNINLSQQIQTDAAKFLDLKEMIQMLARDSPHAAILFS